MTMVRNIAASLTACAALFAALPAHAHVVLAQTSAEPNSSYRAVLRVGHGCAGAATTALTVNLPEGVIAAKPMPKPGWTVSTTKGAYAAPYKYHGTEMTEGTRQISWSGGLLGDDQYDEFVFMAHLAATLKQGETLYFPADQRCGETLVSWNQTPSGDTARLPRPAATLAIGTQMAQATPHMHHHDAAKTSASLTIEQPWSRATPGGAKVAGGFLKITNNGKEADRLVSFTTDLAGRSELHEMATIDGVMRMRELKAGLVIPPGGSVELKPGGNHIMFMDLKQPFKEGDKVTGKLVFEKAGTLDVVFEVRGMGASSAGSGAGGHGAHKH